MDIARPDMLRATCAVPGGFQQAPVMTAMQQLRAVNDNLRAINDAQRVALAGYNAPPCPAGQFAYTFQHPKLGPLDCNMEWGDAAPEAGWPEQVTLCAAYLRGIDISDRLHPREVEAIETEAQKGVNRCKRERIPAEAELIGAELDADSLEQGEPA